MKRASIQRKGSLLYAMAYRKHLITLTVGYVFIAVLLAAAAASRFDSWIIGALVFAFIIGFCVLVWLAYLIALWFFKRESEQSVELSDEGIRETHRGREYSFVPWAGVREIEVAATIAAGASLRVKGSFSEIAISNFDLALTRPMSIREMHAALARVDRLRDLLAQVRAAAPQARMRMTRLARRRMKNYLIDAPLPSDQPSDLG